MLKITKGPWFVKKTKLGKLPPLHVMGGTRGDIFLCSIHETHESDEHQANAHLFAASKDMYEAITIGLTGRDLDGNSVSREEAFTKLQAAKLKAEGKDNG